MKIQNGPWILLGLLVVAPALAQVAEGADSTVVFPQAGRQMANTAFAVGEKLTFEIAYGLINAGTAKMVVADTQWVAGRPCLHVVTTAKSNAFVSAFFTVRDTVETFMDVDGLYPHYYDKRINEGGYHASRSVRYLQDENRVIYTKSRLRKDKVRTKVDTAQVPPFSQDILSAFYFVRTLPLKVGQAVEVPVYGEGKFYPLQVLVHKRETIKVPAGRFKCLLIEPVLQSEGIFKQDGRLQIWVTDDARRLPVLMKSKVAIGSIDCKLTKAKFSKTEREED